MTDEERAYYVERCLRLEARIAMLQGRATESPPPPPPVLAEIVQIVPPAEPQWLYRIQRRASATEVSQMHDLKQRGLSNPQVGRKLGFSEATVRRHTKDAT